MDGASRGEASDRPRSRSAWRDGQRLLPLASLDLVRPARFLHRALCLLRRHPVIEGAYNGSLIELLGDLALLRPVEGLEQFDDLGLGLGHDEYIRPVQAAVECP